MENSDDPLPYVNQSLEKISENIALIKKAQESLPNLEQAYDQTLWAKGFLEKIPEAERRLLPGQVVEKYKFTNSLWNERFPPITYVDPAMSLSGHAYGTSANASLYEHYSVVKWGDEKPRAEVKRGVEDYEVLQEKQKRTEAVRAKALILNPGRISDFDLAVSLFLKTRSGAADITSAAIAIRTALDMVKGELFSKAQKKMNLQKVTWVQMADVLAKNGTGKPDHTLLLSEEHTYKDLIEKLSNAGKNRQPANQLQLESYFTLFVDHLFAVLNLLQAEIFEPK